MFIPNVSTKEDGEKYAQFCKHELFKFCLYIDNIENGYDGSIKEEDLIMLWEKYKAGL